MDSWPARPGRARLGMTLEPLIYIVYNLSKNASLELTWCREWLGEVSPAFSPLPLIGALVFCIKPTSSLPVLQIPILHYEIRYG